METDTFYVTSRECEALARKMESRDREWAEYWLREAQILRAEEKKALARAAARPKPPPSGYGLPDWAVFRAREIH